MGCLILESAGPAESAFWLSRNPISFLQIYTFMQHKNGGHWGSQSPSNPTCANYQFSLFISIKLFNNQKSKIIWLD